MKDGPGDAAAAGSSGSFSAVAAIEPRADTITQALVALYFFLAGYVVRSDPGPHRCLWLMPSVFVVCAALNSLTDLVCRFAVAAYASLPPAKRAWWCADVMQMLYSGGAALAAGAYVLAEPRALQLGAPPPSAALPAALVAASTGYFAFQLWVCIENRLFTRRCACRGALAGWGGEEGGGGQERRLFATVARPHLTAALSCCATQFMARRLLTSLPNTQHPNTPTHPTHPRRPRAQPVRHRAVHGARAALWRRIL